MTSDARRKGQSTDRFSIQLILRVIVNSPRAYDINAKELELAFFKLQKTLHPDHYGQKSQVRIRTTCALSRIPRMCIGAHPAALGPPCRWSRISRGATART